MKTKDNKHSNKLTKFENRSLIISLFAVLVSIISISLSVYTTTKLTEYQISEERRPIVTGLNCEIPFQLEKSSDDVLVPGNIPEKLFPLQIALYNIGPGIAQNCKAEWNEKSVQNATTQMIDLLENHSSAKIVKFSYKQSVMPSWYLYDYIINVEDENSIMKVLYYNGTEYVEENFSLQTARLPYLQSLSIDYSPFNLPLPPGFSLLLLETINQKILTEISVKLCISFQDIDGKSFSENYDVTFSPVFESNIDSTANGYIYISFQAVDTE